MTKLQLIKDSLLPELLAGRLCLDFTNTIEPRDGMAPNRGGVSAERLERREYLQRYQDLVAWGIHAGTLASSVAERLIERAEQQPDVARATLAQSLVVRETLYRIFWPIAHGQTPAGTDVQALVRALAGASRDLTLVTHTDHLEWQWQPSQAFDQMLWPVLGDAIALLVTGTPERIKVCPGVPGEPLCGWLFYDASKNRSRQWCSMEECGGVAKARRQTARRRAGREGARNT